MPRQLAGWVCVLVAGVALAGDKPKDKTLPSTSTREMLKAEGRAEAQAEQNARYVVTKPVGTWTREAKGGADVVCRLQLTITDDRLTLTAESKNADRPETVRLDADYGINKESVLFGVIDTFEGTSPRASEEDFAVLTKLAGQPFSVRFRVEDGVLTLKEFKGMGVGLGEDRKDAQGAVAMVCGRYTKSEPTHLSPQRIHGGILKAEPQPNSDPLLRQDQLLNQSEDLRQIGEVWRRFWFNDQPSHLTPQRIQGGILKADPPKGDDVVRLGGVPYPTPHYLKHYPTYFAPDPPVSHQREQDAMLDPEGNIRRGAVSPTAEDGVKQAKSEEPASEPTRILPPLKDGECGECDPPTDAAVLKVLGEKAKGFDGTVTVVKTNLVDKLDPARLFPIVGQARLHHCHWECRVYFVKDLKAEKPAVEVVYVDTDYLRLASADQIVVPMRMPEK
jgi:hypothetical protein